jgi:PHD/YefM family antitoxin component YafN of YafNO toxin-antitoxin module
MNSETPYLLPDGETAWVIETSVAATHLTDMLTRFREGQQEPLIFGDGGQPEGVVISWEDWRRLMALAADEAGFDHVYQTARERLADNNAGPSIPFEDVAAELGIDLNEDADQADKPKP